MKNKHYIVQLTFEMDICAYDAFNAECRAVAALAKHNLDCDGIGSKIIEEYEVEEDEE